MAGRISERRANRAFAARVLDEVLLPAGAGPLTRNAFQIDVIRGYAVEIELGNAYEGREQWVSIMWRCPRFPRAMTRLQEDAPDLYEAWRGAGRTRYSRTGYGVYLTGYVAIEEENRRLVIRSFLDRDREQREKVFDAAEYFRGIAATPDMDALVEECNFGLSGQILAAMSGVWAPLFLATEQGHAPERIFEEFEGTGFAGARKAWRMREPLSVEGIVRFQEVYCAELGS